MKTGDYVIELARYEHLGRLPTIERAAAELFPDALIPLELKLSTVSRNQLEEAQAEHRLWVAVDEGELPIGFAIAVPDGSSAFLLEVDVHPEHQRKGLGRRLVNAVIDWARARQFTSVSLTTFEHLPWNAPFYERLGFRRLSGAELGSDLRSRLQDEERLGLQDRVAMKLPLIPPSSPEHTDAEPDQTD